MSRSLWLIAALLAGLAIGAMLRGYDPGFADSAIMLADPVGTLWVNAIRMTVIPLVVSTVLAALLAPGARELFARLGWRAAALLGALALTISAVSVFAAQSVFSSLTLDGARAAAAGLAAGPAAATTVPGIGEWLVSLIPVNPVKAAADGAMLPLLIFTIAFGLAATGLHEARRNVIRDLAEAVSEAMLCIVQVVLFFAPLGVFALSLVLAARLGANAIGALGVFVAVVVALCVLVIAAFYPLVAVASTTPVRDFAAASAPGQTVAFSARSSLAALPAMLEGAMARLRINRELPGFFLPISASIFRPGSAAAIPAGAVFVAHLYGVELGVGELATIAVTSALLTFSVPSIPGGTILIMAPVLAAVGIPVAGIGVLLALDAIPDMFRTTTNVTGHMAAVTILDRWTGDSPPVATGIPHD
ncbi:MAG: dicarboxylate/amino acid:cation symporter [Gemmatimonadaceae bacterium]|nr:dicarboxylate/amino acid:cation symporter [Gemmatimonadaceae bacterium]